MENKDVINFIISTNFKKNNYWGIYFSKVWKIENNQLVEITEELSKDFEYKNKLLVIHFWSWTAYSIIKQYLEEKYQNNKINLFDTSLE